MQEVHPHDESRCLCRSQYKLLFIPSTLSCVLGWGPDTVHLTQHSSLLRGLVKVFYFSEKSVRQLGKIS